MSTHRVVVIGAGMVGAACAHLLANEGLSVLVLDARRGGELHRQSRRRGRDQRGRGVERTL